MPSTVSAPVGSSREEGNECFCEMLRKLSPPSNLAEPLAGGGGGLLHALLHTRLCPHEMAILGHQPSDPYEDEKVSLEKGCHFSTRGCKWISNPGALTSRTEVSPDTCTSAHRAQTMCRACSGHKRLAVDKASFSEATSASCTWWSCLPWAGGPTLQRGTGCSLSSAHGSGIHLSLSLSQCHWPLGDQQVTAAPAQRPWHWRIPTCGERRASGH